MTARRPPLLCPDCAQPYQPGAFGPLPERCPRCARFATVLREVENMAAPLQGAVYEDRRRAGDPLEPIPMTPDRMVAVAKRLDRLGKRLLRRAGVL